MASANAISIAAILSSQHGSKNIRVNQLMQHGQRIRQKQSKNWFVVRANVKEITIKLKEDMEVYRGHISPQFVTNPKKLSVEFENARVLVKDQKVAEIKDIIPLLQRITKLRAPLLLIAEDIIREALATLVVNDLRSIQNVAVIKATDSRERNKFIFQDIAILTGVEYQATDLGLFMENSDIDQLGIVRKVTITKDSTIIVFDTAIKEELQARIAQLKKEISPTNVVNDSKKLAERMDKLSTQYYDPCKILKKNGQGAYEIALLERSKLQHVFYVSILKKKLREDKVIMSNLPEVNEEGFSCIILTSVMDTRTVQKGREVVNQFLTRWGDENSNLFSWEDLKYMKKKFPTLDHLQLRLAAREHACKNIQEKVYLKPQSYHRNSTQLRTNLNLTTRVSNTLLKKSVAERKLPDMNLQEFNSDEFTGLEPAVVMDSRVVPKKRDLIHQILVLWGLKNLILKIGEMRDL
ncbi:chaperonin-60alpha [Perilla frutescens var. hirtella]|uniref:Chaperonin-60alpha n=1 Tax=Perilla frutescens var. hirtella TaxID=608512 RepID=A0AAD4PFW3_PERFH|nr:chaperonin-60alpha [Perilla frutescens var. hirtella]